MSARSFLETLGGVAAVIIGRDDGRLVDVAGTTADGDAVAAAASGIARELGQLGDALHLDSGDPFTFHIKGNASGRVVCRQRGMVTVLEVEPKRAMGDLELKLRGFDSWTVVEPLVEDSPPPVVESSELRPAEPMDLGADSRRPKFTGDLHLFGLPDLLEFLRAGNLTGTLHCTSDVGSGMVKLRRGKVIAATSPSGTTVAAFFAQRGLFSRDEVQALVATPAELGDAVVAGLLLDRGAIDAKDLRDARLTAISSAIRELVTWSTGRFSFDTSTTAEVQMPGADVEIDSQALLLRIFTDEDERSRAR